MDKFTFYNTDCMEVIRTMSDNSIDIILTDPPYLYLKRQVLEREFDEDELFKHFNRVLKKDGCVIIFGRGDSFYRWNGILAKNGLEFKEEVIWNKRRNSSPVTAIGRIHETICIRGKGDFKISKSKVEYTEVKKYDIDSAISDIRRIRVALKRDDLLSKMEKVLLDGKIEYDKTIKSNYDLTIKASDMKFADPSISILRSFESGVRDRSIIEVPTDHYDNIHPTQKPVKLLSRLLKMAGATSESIVFDPFMGSCSTGIACKEIGASFIGCEIHKPYYDAALKRFNETKIDLKLF